MDADSQTVLFADVQLWPRAEAEAPPPVGERAARVQPIHREQLVFRPVDVEQLVEPDHPVRAIWELVGQRDLSRFYAKIEAVEGGAGRPAIDPRLLISLWIFAYSQGVSSARELEKLCQYHPAYQWLCGADPVGAHTLSDYRMAHGPALKDLAMQVLALLAEEKMVDLEQVTQDGTKIQAAAGADTFRREPTLQKHLERARQRVEELANAVEEESHPRRRQAQQRAARERVSRMEKALQELEKVRAERQPEEKAKARASCSDPEARLMKQPDGGFAPSYNVQFTVDAKQTVIVSLEVTQDGTDPKQLLPALQRLQQEAGRLPTQVIADGAYPSRENIVATAAAGVDLIGPPVGSPRQGERNYQARGITPEFRPEVFAWDAANHSYTCPAGKRLEYKGKRVETGHTEYTYRAEFEECAACAHKGQCCPTSTKTGRTITRTEEGPEVVAFRAKMETPEAKAVYKKRGQVAEFPHACIKERFALRQFSVRGLPNVKIEAWWVALAFNIQQWIRLCWKPKRLLNLREVVPST